MDTVWLFKELSDCILKRLMFHSKDAGITITLLAQWLIRFELDTNQTIDILASNAYVYEEFTEDFWRDSKVRHYKWMSGLVMEH